MIAFAESDFMKDLKAELKADRRQSTSSSSVSNEKLRQKPSGKPPKKQYNSNTQYNNFLKKNENFEENVDKFNSVDLVFYFREQAEKAGYKFFIGSMAKEASCMKRLMNQFPNAEICAMIEFLYFSEQDYLDKDRLTIGLLSSRWISTIHADMLLWVDDKYSPKSASKRQKSKKPLRGEWTGEKSENETSSKHRKSVIGEWE